MGVEYYHVRISTTSATINIFRLLLIDVNSYLILRGTLVCTYVRGPFKYVLTSYVYIREIKLSVFSCMNIAFDR